MKKITLILALNLLLISGCEIKNQEKIWGVSSLSITDDETVVIKDKKEGPESGLFFRDKKGNFTDELKIKIRENFLHSDGHHVFTYYRLVGIKDGKAIFDQKDVFDARSFGGRNKVSRKTISVAPYSIDE